MVVESGRDTLGEAEAIALAVGRRADLVLLDEREARLIARRLGLRVAGALGVMLRAKKSRPHR